MGERLQLGAGARSLDVDAVATGRKLECPMRRGLIVHVLPAERYNARYRKAVQQFAIRQIAMAKSREDSEEEFKTRFEDPEFVADALVGNMEGLYNQATDPPKKVKYTRARGIAILSDLGHADVREWIVRESLDLGAYYAKAVDEAGNSSRPDSTGRKSGAGRSKTTQP